MKYSILSALLFISIISFSQNLILNPGFEGTLFGWYTDSSAVSYQVFSVDYADKHGGISSMKMENDALNDTAIFAQIQPVQGGHVYYMEFWVKADNMQHYMLPFVQFKHDTSWVYDTYFCPNGNTQGWQVVSSRFWVPDSANQMIIFFAMFGQGTMHFDDFLLR